MKKIVSVYEPSELGFKSNFVSKLLRIQNLLHNTAAQMIVIV